MDAGRTKHSLGHRLFLLAAIGIVPLAVFAAAAVINLVQERRAEAGRAALELSRALASAVHAELSSTVASLESLAIASELIDGQMEDFYALCTRAVANHPSWRGVALIDAQGVAIFKTEIGPTSRGTRILDPASLEEVLRTQKPVVGNLTRARADVHSVPIRVPVMQNGSLRYVLTAAIKPDGIRQILARQKVPEDWAVTVLDGQGLAVARSRDHEKFVGKPPTITRSSSANRRASRCARSWRVSRVKGPALPRRWRATRCSRA